MKKTILIIFFAIFSCGVSFAQDSVCNTSLIYDIFNQQLKIADKIFKRKYFVCLQPKIYGRDTMYTTDICAQLTVWDSTNSTSKKASFKDSVHTQDYFCVISKPYFTKNQSCCRIIMSIHSGEWGGGTTRYIYKKTARG